MESYQTKDLLPEMVTAEPVRTKNGQLVVDQGVTLTKQLIAKIQFYSIESVTVENFAKDASANATGQKTEKKVDFFTHNSLLHYEQKSSSQSKGAVAEPSYTIGPGDLCEDFANLELESAGEYPLLCAGIIDTDWVTMSKTGKGKFKTRAKIEIGEFHHRPALFINTLPSMVFFESIRDKIEKLKEANQHIFSPYYTFNHHTTHFASVSCAVL